MTASTVNGEIACKYIIKLSTGSTDNISRQKLYRIQIKIRYIQTSKIDKINLESAEWFKSLHLQVVFTIDERSVLYGTIQHR